MLICEHKFFSEKILNAVECVTMLKVENAKN